MSKKTSMQDKLRLIALSATLAAMSAVIGLFCKTYLNLGGGLFRITFENLPIIVAGLLFGPVAGGAVGLVGDFVSAFFTSGMPNPVIAAGAVSVGLVSGFVSKYLYKKNGAPRIAVSALSAHIVGSMLIKTLGLNFYKFFPDVALGGLFLIRVPLYMGIAAVEITLIVILFRNKYFARTAMRIQK